MPRISVSAWAEVDEIIANDDVDGLAHWLRGRRAINAHHPESGQTLLHRAARSFAVDCATLLIDRGATINSRDHYGRTPLHQACRYTFGHRPTQLEFLDLLVDAGADVDARNRDGITPMDLARGYCAPAIPAHLRAHLRAAAADAPQSTTGKWATRVTKNRPAPTNERL